MEDTRDLPKSLTGNYTKVICYPTDQIYSHGIWIGDNVFFYNLPLLMFQISALAIASRVTQVLLKPLRQPTIVSSIIGGILLGPSVLGRILRIRPTLFPDSCVFVTRSMACFGIIYQTFSATVKMNISTLTMGRKPAIIGFVGLVLPVAAFLFFAILLQEHTTGHFPGGHFFPTLAFFLTLSPFVNVSSLLYDLQLLNTEVGRLSLTIAMLNEACAWVMIVAVNIKTTIPVDFTQLFIQIGPSVIIILFLIFIIRPLLFWVIRRTPQGSKVEQGCIVAILLGVLIISMVTDAIGLGVLEGCMILGLVVPNGPPLGSAIEQRIDTVAKEIFMPLLYAAIGQRLDLFAVADWTDFAVFVFLILVNMLVRLLGTMMSAVCFRLPFSQALSLGLILNTRGYVDMMTYWTLESTQVVDEQTYAGLVLVALVTTMIGSPLIAKFSIRSGKDMPQSLRTIQHFKPHAELCLMACVHEQDNVPPILKLLEATNPNENNPVCIYVMQLVELVGRATPMLIFHKPEKMKNILFSGSVSVSVSAPIFGAFYNYQRRVNANASVLSVQAFTSMSPYKTMHNDVCSLALQQRASLILVPFHKRQVVAGVASMVDNALQIINPRILAQAPCSVGMIFDRGSLRGTFGTSAFRIGVLFFGGPDDREALSYAARMVEHPSTALNVIRFISVYDDNDNVEEREVDDDLVIEFCTKCAMNERIKYEQKMVHDGEDTINVICSIEDVFDLMVVGRRQWRSLGLVQGLSVWSENPELGVIGDLCSSSDFFGGKASVLVMQQQTMTGADVNDSLQGYTIPQNCLRRKSIISEPRR